jgi:predicted enzyme related to lactoylglutathione lyase
MTAARLEGITVLADDVQRLARFFDGVLGCHVSVREDAYVELQAEGVRFAIFERALMGGNTHDHPSFAEPRRGQAFELNFQCERVDEVQPLLDELLVRGADLIAEPVETTWGHFTAFFGDPEGNIHSLFAVLPAASALQASD